MIKNCEKIWNFWIFLVLIYYSKFLFKNQYFSLRSFRHYTLIIRYQTKIIYYEYNLKLLVVVFLNHYFFGTYFVQYVILILKCEMIWWYTDSKHPSPFSGFMLDEKLQRNTSKYLPCKFFFLIPKIWPILKLFNEHSKP